MDIFTWQDDADTTLMFAIWRMSAHAWISSPLGCSSYFCIFNVTPWLWCLWCQSLPQSPPGPRLQDLAPAQDLQQAGFAETKIVRKINLASRLATLCRTESPPWLAGSGQCRDRPEYRCPGKDSPKLVQVGSYLGQEVPTRVDDDCLNLI